MRSKSGATRATRWRNSRSFRPNRSSNDVRRGIRGIRGVPPEVRMRIRRVGLAIVGFALASVSLGAHHSFAMFQMDKDVEYRGVIREWKWQNPHVHFTLNVTKQPGVDPATLGLWDVEGGSVNIMTRQG